MDTTINQRIAEVVKMSYLTKNAFAHHIGVSITPILNAFNDDIQPSLNTIVRILECYPDISAEWLLRGDGEMLKTQREERVTNETIQELEKKLAKMSEANDRLYTIIENITI